MKGTMITAPTMHITRITVKPPPFELPPSGPPGLDAPGFI